MKHHRLHTADPLLGRLGKLVSAVTTGLVVALSLEWFRKRKKKTEISGDQDPILNAFKEL